MYTYVTRIKEVTKTIQKICSLRCNKLVNNITCLLAIYVYTAICVITSGVAKPRPTRALARASAHLALASEIDDTHNSLQSVT